MVRHALGTFSPIAIFVMFHIICSKRTCIQFASAFEQFSMKKNSDGIIRENFTKRNLDQERGPDFHEIQIKKLKLWPDGVIPYYIDGSSYSDKDVRDRISWFLNVVNSETGINFVEMSTLPPKEDMMRWVFFVNRATQLGCGDHSIRDLKLQGVQEVHLGYECMSTGNELAEAVLAIVGVPPQHNAPNRDEYIQIHKENIIPEKMYLFEKVKVDEWLFNDLEYDFASGGHYHNHRYSTNGRATISVQENYPPVSLGKSYGLSFQDIIKIRILYNNISKKTGALDCGQLFNKRTENHEIDSLEVPTDSTQLEDNIQPNDSTSVANSDEFSKENGQINKLKKRKKYKKGKKSKKGRKIKKIKNSKKSKKTVKVITNNKYSFKFGIIWGNSKKH